MTGLGEFGRLGVIYRNQWPNIGDGLHYVSSWIDYNFLESNVALGLNFSNENQNVSNLTTSNISPSTLNLERQFFLKIFIELSFKTKPFEGLTTKELIFLNVL